MKLIKRIFNRKSDLYSPNTEKTNATLARWHENERIRILDYWEFVERRRRNTRKPLFS